MFGWLRRRFIAGFFVTVPLAVTVAAIVWTFRAVDSLTSGLYMDVLGRHVAGLGLLTTAAALLGAIPLAIGGGEGSEFRQPLGIAVVGGLLVSQILTLYTTPVVYLVLDRLRSRVASGLHGRRPAVSSN